jgi:hypothetical protein
VISIFAIFLIGAGLLVYQRHYMNHHRPLIKAEAMAADSLGAGLLDEIGAPSGAQLQVGTKSASETILQGYSASKALVGRPLILPRPAW